MKAIKNASEYEPWVDSKTESVELQVLGSGKVEWQGKGRLVQITVDAAISV